MRDVLFEPREIVAQLRNRHGELVEFGTRDHHPAFFYRVLHDVLRQTAARLRLPGGEVARRADHPMSQHVAEDARKVFFDIPAQIAQQREDFGGQACVARDVNGAHQVFLTLRHRGENSRPCRNGQSCFAAGFGGKRLSAFGNREPQRRKRCHVQFDHFTRERRELVPRPRLAPEKMVQRVGGACIEEAHGMNQRWKPIVETTRPPCGGLEDYRRGRFSAFAGCRRAAIRWSRPRAWRDSRPPRRTPAPGRALRARGLRTARSPSACRPPSLPRANRH